MEKKCSKCGVPQSTSEFRKCPENKDGLGGVCRTCRNRDRRNHYRRNKRRIRDQQIVWYRRNKEKVAQKNKVYREKPEHKLRLDQQKAEWRRTHKEYTKLYGRRKCLERYGITAHDFEQMLDRQNGVCAVCKETQLGGKNLCIDHDHKTGKVRGLLCVACNMAIGYMKDDPQRLRAAADYLSS